MHVSWDLSWPVARYVDWYLENRRHPRTATWSDAVLDMLKAYPAEGPMRKSDVDYFLDTNASRWKPLASGA